MTRLKTYVWINGERYVFSFGTSPKGETADEKSLKQIRENKEQMVTIKVITHRLDQTPIETVIQILEKAIGKERITHTPPLKSDKGGYHCFITAYMPALANPEEEQRCST